MARAPVDKTAAVKPATTAPTAVAKPTKKVAAPKPATKPAQVAPVAASTPAVAAAHVTEPVKKEPAAPVKKAEKLFVPEPTRPAVAAPLTPKTEGLNIMEDTVKQVQEAAHKMAADATAHVETLVAGATEKTKEAVEKTKKMAEDAVAFHKENAEAVAASGKMVAEGVQSSAAYAAELGRKHFEEASAALKTMAAAKSPSEFFSLQSDYMKSSYEAFIAETSKSSEATMKFFGEVFQPISSRFAVAAEKVKAATTL